MIPASAHAPPTAKGASAIWTVDAKTQQLTRESRRTPRIYFWLTPGAAHWTNLNGSVAKTTIGYDFQANLLFLTGDIDAFNALNNNTAEAVVRISISSISPALKLMARSQTFFLVK